jgi:cephalosporin-C deacetylase-like acetyl esterase
MRNHVYGLSKACIAGVLCASFFISDAAAAAKKKLYQIKILTDRSNAVYKCGEKAEFTVNVEKAGQLLKDGVVNVTLSNDGYKKLSSKKVDLSKENPFKISGSMKDPGFLRCTVSLVEGKKRFYGWGAAGFCPEKIKPATHLPADFKKFWEDGEKRLAEIPLDVKLTKIAKYSNAKRDCYKISFANIDNTRIYGFLSVPKGKGPFPAVVTVPGAGPGFYTPDTGLSSRGVLVLRMNVHKYDPPMDAKKIREVYKELNKGGSYPHHGAPDKEKFYFRRAYLGINRAVNWLCSRPDWDKKHLVVTGSSQGGASTLILAGMNKHVTAAGANVPALCDHWGYKKDRSPGWPRLVRFNKQKAEYEKMAPYFDALNFARFIKCPTVICVGFIDRTCSPSSVYAAYNVIDAPKKIVDKPLMGHSVDKDFYKYMNRWIDGQLGLQKPIAPIAK